MDPRVNPHGSIAAHLKSWVDSYRDVAATPCLLFVSGAQGIGKSTALSQITKQSDGQIAALCLDDVYFAREDRLKLADIVHPLFKTRGPPGTHDLGLLDEALDMLLSASSSSSTPIPAFDKTRDDRFPREAWRIFTGQPAIIIVEGWMMGVLPDPNAPTAEPINQIEVEDSHGIWRRYQEEKLADEYAKLWDRADGFLHLDAPGFETVLEWRLEQERTNLGSASNALSRERVEWVSRFILHYERLTRRMLAGHRRAGVSLKVDQSRTPLSDLASPYFP